MMKPTILNGSFLFKKIIYIISSQTLYNIWNKTREQLKLKTTKIILSIPMLICIGLFTGCTYKSWYQGGQYSAKQNCNHKPASEVDECLKNLNTKTYEEYKTKR